MNRVDLSDISVKKKSISPKKKEEKALRPPKEKRMPKKKEYKRRTDEEVEKLIYAFEKASTQLNLSRDYFRTGWTKRIAII